MSILTILDGRLAAKDIVPRPIVDHAKETEIRARKNAAEAAQQPYCMDCGNVLGDHDDERTTWEQWCKETTGIGLGWSLPHCNACRELGRENLRGLASVARFARGDFR